MEDFDFSTLTAEECVALKGLLDDRLKELQGDITGYPTPEQVANALTSIKEQWAEFLQGYGINANADDKISADWVDKFKEVVEKLLSITKTSLIDDSITELNGFLFMNNQFLTTVDLPNCTQLAGGVFKGCIKLENVNIPSVEALYYMQTGYNNSIKYGNGVFEYCTSLTEISLQSCKTINGNAFGGCNKLRIVDCPIIDTIGAYVTDSNFKGEFNGCTSLTTVTGKPTRIGNKSFYGCTSLVDIDLSEVKQTLGEYAFYNCSSLKEVDITNVEKISNNAFQYCTSLTKVKAYNFTSIGNNVFENCTNLVEADLDFSNVTHISYLGENIFNNCTSLKTINVDLSGMPADFKRFSKSMFYNCTSLENIDVSQITTISGMSQCFYNCTSLKELHFTNLDVGDLSGTTTNVIYNCQSLEIFDAPILTDGLSGFNFYNCINLKLVNLPEYVGTNGLQNFRNSSTSPLQQSIPIFNIPKITRIFSRCFEYFFNNPDLPADLVFDSILIVDQYVFQYCYGLRSIELKNVTSLGQYAFRSCTNLKKIHLGKVTTINNYTFQSCTQSFDLFLGAEQVVKLNSTNAFGNITATNPVTLHVKSGYADSFATATNWSTLINQGKIIVVGDYTTHYPDEEAE